MEPPARIEALSESRYRIEFSASGELRDKIERARELVSHSLPSGDLAALVERAIDQLIENETKRQMGTGRTRKPRQLSPDSRRIPVDVARIVRERDGHQCAFVDASGRRCSERRFITIEHDQPFARGGLPVPENLRLLCKAHNEHTARKVFGEKYIAKRIEEPRTKSRLSDRANIDAQLLGALMRQGFKKTEVKRALQENR